jgi:hypothetical protein
MRILAAAALAAAIAALGCRDATPPATNPTVQSGGDAGPGASGSLTVRAVALGPGVSDDTVQLVPVAGAGVRIYRKEVTVVSCDSVTTPTPTCSEQTYTVPGATDVALPEGGTLRGALAASGNTGPDGRYSATGLVAWIYFVIVAAPSGSGLVAATAPHIAVANDQAVETSVFLRGP